MRLRMLAPVLAAMFVARLHAQESPSEVPAASVQQPVAVDGIRTAPTVVVTGEQPGPGLWLVRRGDHELWILGTLNPLPSGMQWQSQQVEQVIGNAQEVIRAPYVSFKVDTGWFKGLMMLPSLLGARRNPDGKRLQDVVSPQSYARWQALKARYIGRDRGVEKWRPLFAAQELYKEAMEKSGLDGKDIVSQPIKRAIEARGPAVTVVREEIVVKDPKPLLKEFSKTTLDDIACFDNTMTRIETDLDAMRLRANAWATGDMAALQSLPPPYQWEACSSAITEAGIGKRLGFGDAQGKLEAKWLAAAEAALARNEVTFAILGLNDMLGPDGYLAKLQARGYTVLTPDE